MTVRFPNVEIFRIERMGLSRNGNPRFRLHTDQGTFATKTDASLAYGIENYTNTRFPDEHVIGNPGRKVTLVGDGGKLARNRIYAIEF